MASELPPDAPEPRLCHLVKWADFDGYGFNLHAEKAKSGQYIGQVDRDSPAEYAGMLQGDRIIEVNGVNIANENHRQVVERIKAVPYETKLLLVDDAADRWYKERKIVVKSSQANVKYVKTPVPRPAAVIEKSPVVEEKPTTPQPSPKAMTNEVDGLNGNANGNGHSMGNSTNSVHSNSPSLGGSSRSSSPKPKREDCSDGSQASIPDSTNGDLNLNMSAAEMRERLASRKKRDPKKENIDMREKYHIVELL